MKSKIINQNGQKTYALIFETGDEVMEGIRDFAAQNELHASQFTAIGAFRNVVLGYFDFSISNYKKIPLDEQVEVLALTGDVTCDGGKHKIHAHVVVGREDGTTRGGHLLKAHVRPTLEVILTESPAYLERKKDEST